MEIEQIIQAKKKRKNMKKRFIFTVNARGARKFLFYKKLYDEN